MGLLPGPEREIHGTGAPVNGTTGVGVVALGWRYIDDATGYAYLMITPGTTAVPVWGGVSINA